MEKQLYPFNKIIPKLDTTVFVAPGAKIIGSVEIGKNSSVWYNSVIRGDVQSITIGHSTNIQDLSMLHVTNQIGPLILGDEVTIGHSVTLHACTINDRTLIGMGATILDGATIESDSMVGAGALIPSGFTVPSGTLALGVPAKVIRDLTINEIKHIKQSALNYIKYVEDTKDSFLAF